MAARVEQDRQLQFAKLEQATMKLARAEERRLRSFVRKLFPRGWKLWLAFLVFNCLYMKPAPLPEMSVEAGTWHHSQFMQAVDANIEQAHAQTDAWDWLVAAGPAGLHGTLHQMQLVGKQTQSPAQLGPVGIELHENATLAQVLARTKRSSSSLPRAHPHPRTCTLLRGARTRRQLHARRRRRRDGSRRRPTRRIRRRPKSHSQPLSRQRRRLGRRASARATGRAAGAKRAAAVAARCLSRAPCLPS